MKKLIQACLFVLAVSASAQTATKVADAALAERNTPVCDAFGLRETCTDDQVVTLWCARERVQTVPVEMCAAVAAERRPTSERVLTRAEFYAEKNAAIDRLAAERLKRQRRALLVLLEIAVLDDTTRTAVCAAADVATADCK